MSDVLTMYSYPPCGTCRKAKKWLDEHDISYQIINIAEQPPNRALLAQIIKKSGTAIGKFFNTSGKHYREGDYKNKRKDASDEQLLEWLEADGMLIKRPLVFDEQKATVGFSENMFEKEWLEKVKNA
ncbi:Spx/MgsR family RNA polymerase-binding regulatory protein [Sporolactobacillus terrae]|uniref:Spx/MgsR family RNA polymerase-binding regulatory protein n=1 Tax=Sporolactobacillus terrae TaxID=269673 RepID=UPI0005675D2D|nr:Spx/MgsR family RNA polymerase-binding regulatory protein [Sporolactobacillus terrae]